MVRMAKGSKIGWAPSGLASHPGNARRPEPQVCGARREEGQEASWGPATALPKGHFDRAGALDGQELQRKKLARKDRVPARAALPQRRGVNRHLLEEEDIFQIDVRSRIVSAHGVGDGY